MSESLNYEAQARILDLEEQNEDLHILLDLKDEEIAEKDNRIAVLEATVAGLMRDVRAPDYAGVA